MANDSTLFQLFKECEEYIIQSESPNSSLIQFLTKPTKINKKYLSILRKQYLKLIHTNNILIITIFLFLFVQLIISITSISKEFNRPLIISEAISSALILTLVLLAYIRPIREAIQSPFVLVWSIYLISYANILMLAYSYQEVIQTHHVFIHKIYFHLIGSHLIFSLCLNANMSLHFGHFFVLGGLDVFLVIVLNITNTFYYQSFSIVVLAGFVFTSAYNTEVTQKGLYDFCVKKYYNFLVNEEILQNASVGICLCKETFEIKKTNKLFSIEMSDLITAKEKEKGGDKENEADISKAQLNVNSTAKANRTTDEKTVVIQSNKDAICSYLNTTDLIKKIDGDSSSSDKKNNKIAFSKALDDEINFYLSNERKEDMESFHPLGRFKVKKNRALYNVKWKRVYNQTSKQHLDRDRTSIISSFSSGFYYKFIFTLITKNRKYDRIKVEQIYQKLILAKISHEFNEPIALIQAKMDEVALQYKDAFSKDATDSLNEVKYCAETILISVRDLIEYINIHSANDNFEQKEFKKYPLRELKAYCTNISASYLLLMKRAIGIQVHLDEALEDDQIEINDKKLNQILANLISNAIKNTENDDSIGISISKMSAHDIKYFEFGANENMYINGDDDLEEDDGNRFKGKDLLNEEEMDNDQCDIDLGLVIEIEDNGSGINSTLMKEINSEGQTFYRMDTNETKINNAEGYAQCKGLGSGLKICKKLSDDIGAKLKCELKKGSYDQGTIFRLFIKTEITPCHYNSNGNNNPNEVSNLNLMSEESKV